MEIITALISIFIITAFFWLLYKFSPVKICPICAGISGTWIWMLLNLRFGNSFAYLEATTVLALLMGGSVVGIAYTWSKRIPDELNLIWKVTFIPLGFLAQYALLNWRLGTFFVISAMLFLLGRYFAYPEKKGKNNGDRVEQIEKNLENCC